MNADVQLVPSARGIHSALARSLRAYAAKRAREDVITAFVRRTRAASGVPERLEDPAAIERIAALLRGGLR